MKSENEWSHISAPYVDANGRLSLDYIYCNGHSSQPESLICPKNLVEARAMEIEYGKFKIEQDPRRTFLARTFQHDAQTILAILTITIIGLWVSARKANAINNKYESIAYHAASEHIKSKGLSVPSNFNVGVKCLPSCKFVPPINHQKASDIPEKVIQHFKHMLNGRTLLVSRTM